MDDASDAWPTLRADENPPKPQLTCVTILNKVEDKITMPIPIKDITYIHGKQTCKVEENLPFAIIGKFSYGLSER